MPAFKATMSKILSSQFVPNTKSKWYFALCFLRYTDAQIQLRKEQAKVAFEQNKLFKMVDELNAMSDNIPKVNEKWALFKTNIKIKRCKIKS